MPHNSGGDWQQLIDEFTEVESGKRNDRPALEAAFIDQGAATPRAPGGRKGCPRTPIARCQLVAA